MGASAKADRAGGLRPEPLAASQPIGAHPLRVERIGRATLYLGRCEDILPTLGDVDALVTDPPYGQKVKVNTFHAGGKREKAVVQRNGKSLIVRPKIHRPIEGDDKPFDPSHLLSIGKVRLIWGAHKFSDRLPRGSWLVWDKVPNGKLRDQADGEAAWLSIPDVPLRMYRLLWDGLCVGVGARHEVTAGQQRLHPAQKPEVLMAWCLQQIRLDSGTILDPYMGSGSTGVAAVRAGFDFIGIECDEEHFETSCRRIEDAQRQGSLFDGEAA